MSEETTLFISRAGADAAFASEIGRVLEDAGYTVILQQWDFANRNFIERMHASLAGGARVVALLSPEYLRSDHCAAEWQNVIAGDPLNKNGRLVLLRVVECEPPGLLSGLAYWDLVPVRDDRTLVEQIVRNALREDRQDAAPLAGPYWRAPRTIIDTEAIRPISSFTGREGELAELAAALSGTVSTAVVHGLGGTGKSSVAREYAWRSREEHAVVWWLNAETEDGIIDGLLQVGALFVRGLDQLPDRRVAAQQVTRSVLSGFAKPVLLVFDNLEDERLLSAWRPRTGARVVVTSRNSSWGADIKTIALKPWPADDACAYLRRESGRTDLSESVANAIADALGELPLALAHAAAYLRGTRMATPQRYLDHIKEHLAYLPRNAEYPRSVAATFTAAIAEAERGAPGAAAMLCLASWFAPDAIPDELFRQTSGDETAALRPTLPDAAQALDLQTTLASDTSVDAAFGALDRLSLVTFAEASRTYAIHRLVQMAARDLIAGDDSQAWVECAIAAARNVFPHVEFTTWLQCDQLLPHARAALDALPEGVIFLPAADLAHRCSNYSWARGAYADAESLVLRTIAIREKALGPEHPEVAENLNDLATAYRDQGRYGEAEMTLTRALAILEKARGPEHPSVAVGLSNLATVYGDQGRHGEVQATLTRALMIGEKTLGPEHPQVATMLNNLAHVYGNQGHYGEAEAMHMRALAIWEKALGPEHPSVSVSLNNLARLYGTQGRYSEAEAMHKRALAIKEKALGPEHPDVAIGLNNLARLHATQGRYVEAEAMHTRALAIRLKALGPEHPNVATSLNDLARVFVNQGRYGEAEATHRRALAIREKALGPEHPDVTESLCDLASLCSAQGHYDEAERFYRRALALSEKTLGPEHPNTTAIRASLSALPTR